jgi:hypothetical protein
MGSIIAVHASASQDTIYHPTCDATFQYFMAARMVHYPLLTWDWLYRIGVCPLQFIQGPYTVHKHDHTNDSSWNDQLHI